MKIEKCLGGCTLASLIFGLAGLIISIYTSSIFELIIRKFVLLGPNSMSKDMWIDTPKLQTSVYIFDIQNPDEVLKGDKPKLVERGPYVYDEYHHKVNLQWNSNGTVTYENVREYHYNPNESNGSLDDKITIVNAPAGSISYTAKYQMTAAERPLVSFFLWEIGEKPLVSKTVREIIFDGYDDPLLKWVKKLQNILKVLKVPVPPDMDKFAIFYNRNMSTYYDGVFNLITGSLNGQNANQMFAWNFTTETPYFPDKCGKVWGNGELFKPFLPQSKVAMFSNDLCRPLILKFENVSSAKGIWGNRYVLDDLFFANSSTNKENWCFEAPQSWSNPKQDQRQQFPNGVFNLGLCKFNSSTFISQPHFLDADPFYINQFVDGSLKPDATKHQTTLVIDPQSGIPIEVIARFQANVLIEPVPEITMFKNFKKPIFMPAFWFETKMSLPDNMKFQMWALSNLQTIFSASGYATFGLAIGAILVMAIFYQVHRVRENKKKGPVLVEGSTEDLRRVAIVREDSSIYTPEEDTGDSVPILTK